MFVILGISVGVLDMEGVEEGVLGFRIWVFFVMDVLWIVVFIYI